MHAAIFDVDGTIVKAQTQLVFGRILARKALISQKTLWHALWIVTLYRLGLIRDSSKLRKRFYASVASYPVKKMISLLKDFSAEVKKMINGDLLPVIEEHRKRGDMLIAVSGTLEPLCAVVCGKVGISEYYGTRLVIRDGMFTGDWEGDVLEGEAKADFVRRLLESRSISPADCHAYADSITDEPLLNIVGHPVVVRGDRAIRRAAREKGWRMIG